MIVIKHINGHILSLKVLHVQEAMTNFTNKILYKMGRYFLDRQLPRFQYIRLLLDSSVIEVEAGNAALICSMMTSKTLTNKYFKFND